MEALWSSLEIFPSSFLKAFDAGFSAMLDKSNIFVSDGNISSFDSILNHKGWLFPVLWSVFHILFYHQAKIFDLSFALVKLLDLLLVLRGWAKSLWYYFCSSTIIWTCSGRSWRTWAVLTFQVFNVFHWFLILATSWEVLSLFVFALAIVDLDHKVLVPYRHSLGGVWNFVHSCSFVPNSCSLFRIIELLDDLHLNFKELIWLLYVEWSCSSLQLGCLNKVAVDWLVLVSAWSSHEHLLFWNLFNFIYFKWWPN